MSDTPTKPTLPEMIRSAERELSLRRRAYAGWVRQGRMRREDANHEIACMEGIIAELTKLQHLREVSEDIRSGRI